MARSGAQWDRDWAGGWERGACALAAASRTGAAVFFCCGNRALPPPRRASLWPAPHPPLLPRLPSLSRTRSASPAVSAVDFVFPARRWRRHTPVCAVPPSTSSPLSHTLLLPRRSRVRLWCRHWRYLANRRYHSHCRFCGRGPCFCCYREHRRRRCRCRRSFRCRCCCSSRCCCRRCGVFRSSFRCWCRGRRRGGWLLSRPLPLSLDRLQPSALTLPPPLELEVSGAAAAVVLLLGVPPPRPPPLPL